MSFSKCEQPIIEVFYKNLQKIKRNDILTLMWKKGIVMAIFDTCFDDFNEDNETEEYTSFVFKMIKSEGNPPIEVSETKYFVVNYHNFPENILLNGEKIN